jgi:hypothetical protein
LFLADVEKKQCALTCYGNGSWYVRRHARDGQPIVFRQKTDLFHLIEYSALEIIPAIHPEDSLEPTEGVLDLDVSPYCSLQETIDLSDDFTRFLNDLGFQYYRRISGGKHEGGQHFIIPVKLTEPLPLVFSLLKPSSFLARHSQELLINSLRHTLQGLVLHYLMTRTQQFPLVKRVAFSNQPGYWTFDLRPNALHSGRRCVLSSSAKSERLVIPIPSEPLDQQYYKYLDITDPDEALFHTDWLMEPNLRTDAIRTANTRILHEIGESIAEVFVAWKSLYPIRFRNLYLGGNTAV